MYKKIFPVFLLLSLTYDCVYAQTNNISPYSRFGIGDIFHTTSVQQTAMGGIGIANRSPWNVNGQNPAGYSALMLTSFEAGLRAQGLSIVSQSEPDSVSKLGNISVHHLALGFPVSRKAGIAFGLLPVSTVGYKLTTKENVEGTNSTATVIYEGSGGLSQFFLGAAHTIGKKFNFGFNVSYLLGSIQNVWRVELDSTVSTAYKTRVQRNTDFNGVSFTGGLQYEFSLNENKYLRLGAVAQLSPSLNAERRLIYGTLSSSALNLDTLESITGMVDFPYKYGFGFELGNNKSLMMGADITLTQWSRFNESYVSGEDTLENTFHIGLGGEWIPDSESITNYFKRIAYRAGISFSNLHTKWNGEQIQELSLSFGAGIPFPKNASRVNVAFELGRRGISHSSPIKENFIRASLSVNLNEKWFVRKKID